MIDFALMCYADPDEATFQVGPEGQLGERVEPEVDNRMIRQKEVSVLLNQQTAYDLSTRILSELISSRMQDSEHITPEDVAKLITDEFIPRERKRREDIYEEDTTGNTGDDS